MFMQVYFHKTRSIYDFHYEHALKELLTQDGGFFPAPDAEGLPQFLKWDDWRVLGGLHAERGGEHGLIISSRAHHRLLHSTTEVPTEEEHEHFDRMFNSVETHGAIKLDAKRSWYKFQREEIRVRSSEARRGRPLTTYSPVVNGLKTVNQRRIYIPVANRVAETEQTRVINER